MKKLSVYAVIGLILFVCFGLAYWHFKPQDVRAIIEVRLLVPKHDIGPRQELDPEKDLEEKSFSPSVLVSGGPYLGTWSELDPEATNHHWVVNIPLHVGEPIAKASLSKRSAPRGLRGKLGPNDVATNLRHPSDPSGLVVGQLIRLEGTFGGKVQRLEDVEILGVTLQPQGSPFSTAPGTPARTGTITIRTARSDAPKLAILRKAPDFKITPQELGVMVEARAKVKQAADALKTPSSPTKAAVPISPRVVFAPTRADGSEVRLRENQVAMRLPYRGKLDELVLGQQVAVTGTLDREKTEVKDLEVLEILPASRPDSDEAPRQASITVVVSHAALEKLAALRQAKDFRIVLQESASMALARMAENKLRSKQSAEGPSAIKPAAPSVPAASKSKDP